MSNGGASETGSDLLGNLTANVAAGVGGALVGGAAGASTASSVYLYNQGNDRKSMIACDIISAECKGSVLREFPGQYLNSPLSDIMSDAASGGSDARKALKLLKDNRFKK
ncbi:hypothetical protein [Paraburkholderia adhaesiva]|uniref:hypothetical protein n=1 Tax=Paraburkholderia adhaesiva TaxID=2883244 RepID=UPI001F38A857|nr:hypothetical protein [Paraburkholderia adhaesiva]